MDPQLTAASYTMPAARAPQSIPSAHGKLASMAWPLLLTMTLMLLLSVASMSTLSALRAYVNGEGRWSKAEGQAIADLRRYCVTGDELHFERFFRALARTCLPKSPVSPVCGRTWLGGRWGVKHGGPLADGCPRGVPGKNAHNRFRR